MTILHNLYNYHHGKVADKWALYLHVYEDILASKQNTLNNILEIGVQNGGSLEIWAKYFTHANSIVGCDINEDCRKLMFDNSKIHLVVGDANDLTVRESIVSKSAKYDLIIDDGSHTSSDIITSFFLYFAMLETDGIYIIEDLHCSYWSEFEGGLYKPNSAMNFLKKIADIVNFENWGNTQEISSILFPFIRDKEKNEIAQLDFDLTTIHSVTFYNSLCIIKKQPSKNNILNKRIVVGEDAPVVAGMLSISDTIYINHVVLDQKDNLWANMELSPEFDWLKQQKEVKQLKELLEKKENLLEQKSKEISSLAYQLHSFQKSKLIKLGAQLDKLRKNTLEKEKVTR